MGWTGQDRLFYAVIKAMDSEAESNQLRMRTNKLVIA